VVRLRPALIFQRAAASEIARFFLGPLVPRSLVRRALIPIVPAIPGVKLQAVHADDVGAAYQLAVTKPDARGAYNIAAEPVLDPPTLGRLLHARPVPVPVAPVRALMAFAWWLRLQPSEPGWLDMGVNVPLMDTRRAREELGWSPTHDAGDALLELLEGMSDKAGGPTPVLRPRARLAGPVRVKPGS
jgi:nucleoside-diphosphate-sugar epimerase